MGKGFDIKSAFRLAKQQRVDCDDDDGLDAQKTPKRNTFHDLFRTSARQRRDRRKTQIIYNMEPQSPSAYMGQRPVTMQPGGMMRSRSEVVRPPASTKEPAILSTWGAKAPSPIYLPPENYFSGGLHDSFTGRHQSLWSPPSPDFAPKPEPRYLTKDEVESMFCGAPKFEITDTTVGPQPSVTFQKGAATVDFKDAKDVDAFALPAFAAVSMKETLLEIPDMRSFAGRNPGTVGYAYFLQLPISDGNLSEKETDPSSSKRVDLLETPEKLGLQALDLESLVDHLTELGNELQLRRFTSLDSNSSEQRVAELHSELFSKFLVPVDPSSATSSEDSDSGLEAQVAALVQVLDTTELWIDFSYVEWRIRLGHILWSAAAEEDESVNEDEQKQAATSDHSVLLLQVALASELQLRLDMSAKPMEARSLSRKIRWDLVLARRFLNNILITQNFVEDAELKRASIFSAMTFVTAFEEPEEIPDAEHIIYPRHEKRQLEGLLKFAEALSWPHAQEIGQRFQDREHQQSPFSPILGAPTMLPALSAYANPVQTSGQFPARQAGSSGATAKPQLQGRTAIAQSIELSPVSLGRPDAGGWLSRSWMAGLVLPGETASHFLITSLLENSPAAIERLGSTANLYGGFVYSGRSYWSKTCVVGRVLAAETGAGECMGWVSSPSVPVGNDKNNADKWINVETRDAPTTTSAEARIASKDLVANESAFVLGREEAAADDSDDDDNDSAAATIQESDFTWPVDGPPILGNEARYEGLTLLPLTMTTSGLPSSSSSSSSPPISSPTSATSANDMSTTSIACLKFAPKNQKRTITVPLVHDVYFISSHPCFPASSQQQQQQQPPASRSSSSRPTSLPPPSLSDSPSLTPLTEEKDPLLLASPTSSRLGCHPLHAGYTMDLVPAATLLSCTDDSAYHPQHGGNDTTSSSSSVLVLDCQDSVELELLSRAWCAKVGQHAVVAKAGRTCLSCCVREAKALGVGVVIRI